MKRISILGCGWLGLPLGAELAKNGFLVKGSTTRREKKNEIQKQGITPFIIDLNSKLSPASEFFDTDILIVTIPPGNAPETKNYFAQLEKIISHSENGSVKNTIFISSTSVYPSLNKEVKESDASESALTRSGISLLQAEALFSQPENTIIRFAGLVGENRHPGRWFAGRQGLKGGNLPINMIHLEDCIGIISAIIDGDHWGEIFNACAQDHPLKKEYYQKMAKDLGLALPDFEEEDSSGWKVVSSKYLVNKTGYAFTKSVWDI